MAHAQMLCHPETKSKVCPNEKNAHTGRTIAAAPVERVSNYAPGCYPTLYMLK